MCELILRGVRNDKVNITKCDVRNFETASYPAAKGKGERDSCMYVMLGKMRLRQF